MTLHIGSMMPDRSLDESALIKAITKIAMDLAGLRNQVIQKKTPLLDIVFLLPSRQEQADFTGLRLHSFDSAGQILRIESAVPEKMVTSIHAERFVIAIMQDAIDAAGEFFNEQRILFDTAGHLALVDSINTVEQRALN
ncbi:hypothetical protein IVG45_02980 [Methylomonas sp. LL1]|uniref:hypothetical protein n=1 Tax=Methylomonas sp. LL1 TaxID=2785785 RepID=UPI0018C42CFD|nr:hypothetical protein [Methylomonas sp. LL1]QPK63960.1 hypothetical protein IVG45_02980 [Methylomonas sp. LL1]